MEISAEKLQEMLDERFEMGSKALALQMFHSLLKELGEEERTKGQLIAERQSAILSLRSICETHGDNDWLDNLHLADIINKHLGDHLYERQG